MYNRRHFLAGATLAGLAAPAIVRAQGILRDFPFKLGVAAGELATARNMLGVAPKAPWTWSSTARTVPVAAVRSTRGTRAMEEEVADMVCSLKVMKVIENLCLFSAPLQFPVSARTIWHIKSKIHTKSSKTMPTPITTPAQASTPLDRLSPLLERFRVRAHLFHNGPLCGVTHFAAA